MRRRRHVGDVNQLTVEDEIRLGWNAGVIGPVGNGVRAVGHLPGNEDAALAANLQAFKAVVEAGNHATHALWNCDGLRLLHHGFSVGTELRLRHRPDFQAACDRPRSRT